MTPEKSAAIDDDLSGGAGQSSRLTRAINILFPQPRRFWCYMVVVLIYTLSVLWIDDHYFPKKEFFETSAIMTATSIVIGLLLTFRTNSAYDRWWEGRKLWGQLVNEIRNLSITIQTLTDIEDGEKRKAGQLLIAFPYSLKDRLRGKRTKLLDLGVEGQSEDCDHLPLYISHLLFSSLADWTAKQGVTGFLQVILDRHLRALMDICGACERIQKSPIAPSYKTLIWMWLVSYLLVVPWLLVPILDSWAVLVMLLGTYFIIAAEMLAEEVEDPFGTCANDLPLDSICKTIEISVRQVIEARGIKTHRGGPVTQA